MTISYSEQSQLTCPNCGADFEATVWLVLDGAEEPQATEALRAGRINTVVCPHCGNSGPAGAPLLFHDAATRQVIFAAAPGSAEHEWREQARELHGLLVGSIPEEQRRAYLADVQIAQDVEGIAHLLRKHARRFADKRPETAATRPETADRRPEPAESLIAHRQSPIPNLESQASESPLLEAVQALLAADSPAELHLLIARHPILLEATSDTALLQLADVAIEQREYEIADSLQQARLLLSQMRTTVGGEEPQPTAGAPASTPAPPEPISELPDAAYQGLVQAQSNEQLAALVAQFPTLLAPGADALLATRVDQALEEGNERLAAMLDERRESLRDMAPMADPGPADDGMADPQLFAAVEALLIAEDEESMAQVINEQPLLLSEAAQQMLWQIASEARAGGDEDMAIYALECRKMLRNVKEGLGN